MNDNYFDKKIREILQHPPEFEPSPAARRDMRKKLDALARPARHAPLPWWWVLFPLGILAGWWWGRHSSPPTSTRIAHARDTIVVEKRFHTRDTVFIYSSYAPPKRRTAADAQPAPHSWHIRSAGIHSGWAAPQPFAPAQGRLELPPLPPAQGTPALTAAPSPLSLAARAPGRSEGTSATSRHFSPAPALATLPPAPIEPRHARDPLLDDDRIVLPPLGTSETELPLWMHFVPVAASVQMTAGPAYFLQRGFEELEGWTLRLSGRLHFARGTFLQAGIGQISQSFKVEDTEVMARFPQIEPENPGDQLHDIYADNLSFVEVPIVVGWEGHWGQWRPMLGAGLTLRNALKQQLRYEFIDAQNEYYIPVSFDGGRFDLHTWSVHLGIGRHLWQGLSATAAVRFEKDWRQGVEDVISIQYAAPTLSLRWQW